MLLLGLCPAAAAQSPPSDAVADERIFDCVIEPNVVVEVGSGSPGVLASVPVDRSDPVEKGQVIATLDAGVERASVELAKQRAELDTEVRVRAATLEFADRTYGRTTSLFKKSALAENTLDEVRRDAVVSRLRLRQAREDRRLAALELRRAEEVLKRRTILSPVTGVVVARYKSPGEYVDEQPLMRVAQLDPLRVETILPVEQFGTISNGMRARVVPEHGVEGERQATVVAIDRVLDAASGTFGVRLELPNSDRSLPGGLRCTLEFLPGGGDARHAEGPATGSEPMLESASIAEPASGTTAAENVAGSASGAPGAPGPGVADPLAIAEHPDSAAAGTPTLTGDAPAETAGEPSEFDARALALHCDDSWYWPATSTPVSNGSQRAASEPPDSADMPASVPPIGASRSGFDDESSNRIDGRERPAPTHSVEAAEAVSDDALAIRADAVPAASTDTVLAGEASVDGPEQGPPGISIGCRSLGPIEHEQDAQMLARALASHSLSVEPRTSTWSEVAGYIVMAELESGSPDAIRDLVDRLEANGVDDYYVFRDPPVRVSLGVYRGPVMAGARVEELASLGIAASMVARERARSGFTLDVVAPDLVLDGGTLMDTVARVRPGLRLEAGRCAALLTARR